MLSIYLAQVFIHYLFCCEQAVNMMREDSDDARRKSSVEEPEIALIFGGFPAF